MRLLLAILLLLIAVPAQAQQGQGMSQAWVVSSCGTQAFSAGPLTNLTMNPQGQLCLVGIGGGGGPTTAPVNSALPVASGTAIIASALSCSTGTWTQPPITSYAYQWKRGASNIAGATSSAYTTVSADGGQSLTCVVTATNAIGASLPATSNALAILGVPANSVAPVASGSLTVGATLSCTTGTWSNSPSSYAYTWLRAGSAISGATSATYVTVSADGGTSVGCAVVASNASGNSSSVASNTLAIVSGSGCTAATNYLARTTGGNEGGNAANITTLICGLVTDGVWSNLDALYVFAQQNRTDAELNLIGTNYSITENAPGAPTFTSYVGFSGFNGNNSFYLNTGFNASSAPSPKYTQNSASYGAWSLSVVTENLAIMGNGTCSTCSILYPSFSDGGFYARVNDIGGGSVPTIGTKGLYVGDRSSPTSIVPYWNGASQGSVSSTSGAVANAGFNIGASFPGLVRTTSQTICGAFIGGSLGALNLALYTRLRAYMSAVGVP